jgi:hypothetical protein
MSSKSKASNIRIAMPSLSILTRVFDGNTRQEIHQYQLMQRKKRMLEISKMLARSYGQHMTQKRFAPTISSIRFWGRLHLMVSTISSKIKTG